MDKKLLIAMVLSLGTVWVFNQYFGKKTDAPTRGGVVSVGQVAEIVPGQPVKVPTTQELLKPLELDVKFSAQKHIEPENIVHIETDRYKAAFSNYGAIMTSLDFKKNRGKNNVPLRTVYNKGSFEDEQRRKGCFLLAFDDQTPYAYTLVEKRVSEKATEVAFKAETEQWIIEKTYVFYNSTYKIDLILGFKPKNETAAALKPRLFFVAPFTSEVADDTISVFSWNEEKLVIDKAEQGKLEGLAWFWSTPDALFGAEDRYFAHALVSDESKFVQRAYVKQFDTKNILPILEGPEVKDAKSWKLSFYMGPKDFDELNAVDSRLQELLSFGWLSWLCKLLLKLLAMVYSFVGNYGLAIIIMTVLLKLPFSPLSIYARKKMEVYQHYQPAINKIRLKYRADMKMQQEELMRFYRDHNIAPSTHVVGCLPLLIQMPILFALYRVLNNYVDLYHAPFFGWIVDLSAKDPLYILPVLMGLSMIWQQAMTPVNDGKQRVMMLFMSIVMTVVFAGFPAGLVLYWLMNNLLTIAEDYVRKYFFR